MPRKTAKSSKKKVSHTAKPKVVFTTSSFNKSVSSLAPETKTLVTILLLIFAYPIGLVVMLFWVRWPLWLKLIIALPVTFVFFFIVLPIVAAIFLISHKYKENVRNTQPVPVVTTSPTSTPTPTPTIAPTAAKMKY